MTELVRKKVFVNGAEYVLIINKYGQNRILAVLSTGTFSDSKLFQYADLQPCLQNWIIQAHKTLSAYENRAGIIKEIEDWDGIIEY